jgi:hypothetical protein
LAFGTIFAGEEDRTTNGTAGFSKTGSPLKLAPPQELPDDFGPLELPWPLGGLEAELE